MRSERLRVLRGELVGDVEAFQGLKEKYGLIRAKLARIEPDEFDYVALAYSIVNLYSLMENYFFRVAKYFENRLERSGWHRDLVRRMAVNVEGIRPAFLSGEEARAIDELRAFRHVFRHLYRTELDLEKLQLVDARTHAAIEAFEAAHGRFLSALDVIIQEAEEE